MKKTYITPSVHAAKAEYADMLCWQVGGSVGTQEQLAKEREEEELLEEEAAAAMAAEENLPQNSLW